MQAIMWDMTGWGGGGLLDTDRNVMPIQVGTVTKYVGNAAGYVRYDVTN